MVGFRDEPAIEIRWEPEFTAQVERATENPVEAEQFLALAVEPFVRQRWRDYLTPDGDVAVQTQRGMRFPAAVAVARVEPQPSGGIILSFYHFGRRPDPLDVEDDTDT